MTYRSFTLALAAFAAASVLVASPAPASATSDVSLTCFPHAPTGELRFDDTWGAARSGGRGHKGTDVMSPKGLEVLAVADGVVAGLKNGSSSGYYVRLLHEGGWESWYMHLNNDTAGTDDGRGGEAAAYAPGLSIGDRVRAGEVIAYVGDSGNAEWAGSHTHFELHIDGRAVNPYPYLVDVKERVDTVFDAFSPLVSAPATMPADELDSLRGQVWGELAASGSASCLSGTYKEAIEHVFGELPSEGVLLTGVVAR